MSAERKASSGESETPVLSAAGNSSKAGAASLRQYGAVLASSRASNRKDVPKLHGGDRIEVLWTIERDPVEGEDETADAEDEQRWWGAKVLRPEAADNSFVVRYDAYEEFPPSEVSVTLLGPRTLSDASAGGERMRWRREGDTSEGADWDLLGNDAGEISVREIVQAEEETGESDAVMEEFGKLPAQQQSTVAASYRIFADEVKAELSKLVAQRGPGTVVTEKDVSDMVCILKARHGLT
jgi:hypothetical protein